MRKYLSLIALMATATAAMADSYTVTFKDCGGETDGSVHLNGSNAVSEVVDEGLDYVSSIGGEGNTAAFLGKLGMGVKLGSGKAAGTLTLNLSALGSVNADKIVVNAAAWKDGETAPATVNDKALAEGGLTSTEFADYEVTFDSEPITSIVLSGTDKGRYYVKSLTVYYTPVAETFDAALAHSPRYNAGKVYENVLGPDMIVSKIKTDEEHGPQAKPAIADKYQWIQYVNPTSTLDDGSAEVQQSNRWTNYNPLFDDYNYGDGNNWIQVTGNNGSVNSPVLSSAWGKYMVIYVKETTKVELLGIGSGSGSAEDGNNIKIVAVASDNSEVIEKESTPGAIYGKGTASDTVSIALDPEKAYMLTIKGNETVNKDIMLGNIRLYGTCEEEGLAPKTANTPSYAYWETVKGPDMLVMKNKTNAETGELQEKPAITSEMPWIVYVNPTSTLDDGSAEVQQSNRWTDINPETGVKGEWIQVTGDNGSVNSPVLSSAWGKYMKFYVTGTKKFGVYATGSASGSAEDGNRLLIHALPYNSNVALEAATEAGTIYGKGTASDCVFIELDETEAYEIIVEGDPAVNKDIQLLAVTLQNADDVANEDAQIGTLNIAIAKAVAANEAVVELAAGKAYSLVGTAATGVEVLTINANGATITADSLGQIAVQKGVIINDAIIYGGEVAPVALSAEPAAELAMWTAGIEEVKDEEGNVITPAVPETMKYENATFKGYEADIVEIDNSTIITRNSLIRANANWALRNLNINKSIVEVKYKSGKAFINFEENGAGVIQNIDIAESTLYADSANTDMRFLRYASQNDPWRIWGYEGEDKNATVDTWTMTNNTIVSLCGNKEFANNIKNTAATVEDWKGNIFVNTWRLQKVGSNNTLNFTAEDNFIQGGWNEVDGTDASKYATVDSMAIVWNFAELEEGAPAATDLEALKAAFAPYESSLAAQAQAGDPRWAVEYVDPNAPVEPEPEDPVGIEQVSAESNAAAYNVMGQRTTANGIIVKGGKLQYVK